jgi:hypothetical protein
MLENLKPASLPCYTLTETGTQEPSQGDIENPGSKLRNRG